MIPSSQHAEIYARADSGPISAPEDLRPVNNKNSLQQILRTLSTGAIEVSGHFVWGSNYTLLVRVGSEEDGFHAVYKPSQGEQPLWDFPPQTLAHREAAAYLTSQALGWNLVPPTVLRSDGPGGGGSLQLFVEADPERHYFTFSEADKKLLRPAALFDIVINNADRKGGHVILGENNHIWLIDHGVCFHQDYKLRTVIWDFAGEQIPPELQRDLETFGSMLDEGHSLRAEFNSLLSTPEVEAMSARIQRLLDTERFPGPGPGRAHPWPLV